MGGLIANAYMFATYGNARFHHELFGQACGGIRCKSSKYKDGTRQRHGRPSHPLAEAKPK